MSKAELDVGVEVTACVVGVEVTACVVGVEVTACVVVHSSTITWLSLVWF